MKKLKEDFVASGGEFEKWRVGDLFLLKSNPQLDKDSFVFSENAKYPYFTRTVFNNGIFGQVNFLDEEHLIKGNSIAVGMMGMQFFYMRKDFYAGQFTKTAYPKFEKFNESIALYFISLLNKFQKKYLGVLVRDFEETFYNTEILLPIFNKVPAYNYMEQYISLLEEEKMLQVDKFLKDSGLNDTTLTAEETAALEKFRNGKVKFKEWKICGDDGVFSVNNTHSILQSWIEENSGEYPYCTASESNNSVSSYISYDMGCIEKGNSIMIGGKTLVVTYQEKDYFSNDSHNLALYSKDVLSKNKECQLFLVSQLYKCLKPIYYWGDSISKTKIQKDIISLPVNGSDGIDYDFMHHFISAQEKLAIKGVVRYKDKKIEAAKEIVTPPSRYLSDSGSYCNTSHRNLNQKPGADIQ